MCARGPALTAGGEGRGERGAGPGAALLAPPAAQPRDVLPGPCSRDPRGRRALRAASASRLALGVGAGAGGWHTGTSASPGPGLVSPFSRLRLVDVREERREGKVPIPFTLGLKNLSR